MTGNGSLFAARRCIKALVTSSSREVDHGSIYGEHRPPGRPGYGKPADHVDSADWNAIGQQLDTHGCATIPLLNGDECRSIAAFYEDDARFRSRIVMARHGFGRANTSISLIRCRTDRRLAHGALSAPRRIANRWNDAMRLEVRYPQTMPTFWSAATRPARPGRRLCSSNTPPATTIACIRTSTATSCFRCRWRSCFRSPAATSPAASSCSPSSARACSRAPEVVPLRQGDGVIFPVHHRPVQGRAEPIALPCGTGSAAALRPPSYARHHLPRREVEGPALLEAFRGITNTRRRATLRLARAFSPDVAMRVSGGAAADAIHELHRAQPRPQRDLSSIRRASRGSTGQARWSPRLVCRQWLCLPTRTDTAGLGRCSDLRPAWGFRGHHGADLDHGDRRHGPAVHLQTGFGLAHDAGAAAARRRRGQSPAQGVLGRLFYFGRMDLHGTGVDDIVLPMLADPMGLRKALQNGIAAANIAIAPMRSRAAGRRPHSAA